MMWQYNDAVRCDRCGRSMTDREAVEATRGYDNHLFHEPRCLPDEQTGTDKERPNRRRDGESKLREGERVALRAVAFAALRRRAAELIANSSTYLPGVDYSPSKLYDEASAALTDLN